MGLTAKNSDGENFAKAPEGTHLARCFKVIDLGTQYSEKWDKFNHKIMVVWELPEKLIPDGELKGQPFAVVNDYTLSLGEKSNLRKDLESWRGKSFTDEELAGFNIGKLAGATCFLNLVYNKTEKRTFVNISSIMKLPDGTKCPPAINKVVVFDLDNFDAELFETFSDYLKEKIESSKEYKAMFSCDEKVVAEETPICRVCNSDLDANMECLNSECPEKTGKGDTSESMREDQPGEGDFEEEDIPF